MPNLSIRVDEIRDYMRRGMPEGAEPVIRDINVLFNRIEELERSLIPFARQGLSDNEGKPLIMVYHNDCKKAYATLSGDAARAAEAHRNKPEPEYFPAE